MDKVIKVIGEIFILLAVTCLAYGSFLFMKFNRPIIKQDGLLYTTLAINLIAIIIALFIKGYSEKKWVKYANLLISICTAAFIVYSVMNSVLFDYFQPISLYDQIIYVVLVGLVLLIAVFVVQSIITLFTKRIRKDLLVVIVLTVLFILQFYVLGTLQKDFEYTNIEGEVTHIFEGGEGGYDIFRIPTILILPEGSKLANGKVLEQDQVIVMAEARRNGSLDDGDIDLVQKISSDGGLTWSNLMVVRTYEVGVGKIGNSTPMFDSNTGEIILPHLSGSEPKDYKTYSMISGDGGLTWSKPEFVYDGLVGPGHGIMIENGLYEGRLVAPGYHDGGSLSIYSDDHGRTWQISEKLADGNESEIVQVNEAGDLIMVVRTNQPVSSPHNPLNKLYVTSTDGGASWSELMVMEDIKEPICMSSIVNSGGVLYYSHPDDYYSRGQMTIVASYDEGKSFTERRIIYQGASGYSELDVLSDGNLLLLFESGAIEYDERITIVNVPKF